MVSSKLMAAAVLSNTVASAVTTAAEIARGVVAVERLRRGPRRAVQGGVVRARGLGKPPQQLK